MEIPDFRDPAVREKYRNDHFCQTPPIDPERMFPDGHDQNVTSHFNSCILSMEKCSIVLRKALDGAKIYDQIPEKAMRLEVVRSVKKAQDLLPELLKERSRAEQMLQLYPECHAADALRSMMQLAEPEILDGSLAENLNQIMNTILEKD